MKRLFMIIIILLVFFSCTKKEIIVFGPLELSEISAEVLWNRITTENNYKYYPQWPGHEGIRRGQAPHGTYHEIFMNSVLYNSLPLTEKIAPVGTIIVKENFSSEKKLGTIVAMVKVEGFDQENNDWFWALYESDGVTIAEGKVNGCINCHNDFKTNDYIIIRDLDRNDF